MLTNESINKLEERIASWIEENSELKKGIGWTINIKDINVEIEISFPSCCCVEIVLLNKGRGFRHLLIGKARGVSRISNYKSILNDIMKYLVEINDTYKPKVDVKQQAFENLVEVLNRYENKTDTDQEFIENKWCIFNIKEKVDSIGNVISFIEDNTKFKLLTSKLVKGKINNLHSKSTHYDREVGMLDVSSGLSIYLYFSSKFDNFGFELSGYEVDYVDIKERYEYDEIIREERFLKEHSLIIDRLVEDYDDEVKDIVKRFIERNFITLGHEGRGEYEDILSFCSNILSFECIDNALEEFDFTTLEELEENYSYEISPNGWIVVQYD